MGLVANLTAFFIPSVSHYRKSDYARVYALHHLMAILGFMQVQMKEEYGFTVRMTNAVLAWQLNRLPEHAGVSGVSSSYLLSQKQQTRRLILAIEMVWM